MLPMSSSCLTATLDALDAAQFWRQTLGSDELAPVARWIAAQQDVLRLAPGVWRAEQDVDELRLFTGERVRTRVAAGNILGVEACRALVRLAPDDGVVEEALSGALLRIGHRCFANGCTKGECATSAVAYWRYLSASGDGAAATHLSEALASLAERRDGKGRWQGFPFHYTLLALLEMELPEARAELEYARPACERLLGGRSAEGEYGRRQHALLERVLALA